MARDLHTISVMNGTLPRPGRSRPLRDLPQQAHLIGGGAGQAVNLDITMNLPASYTVQCTPDQDAVCYVTNRTQAGFRVVISASPGRQHPRRRQDRHPGLRLAARRAPTHSFEDLSDDQEAADACAGARPGP
jgi:hypothetical protein